MRKHPLFSLVFGIAFIITTACNKLENPTAPSRPNINSLTAWYPCVVVQTPGVRGNRELVNQMAAVNKLHNAGRMDWIRLGDIDSNGTGRDYAIEAKNMGIKVLAILDLEDLDEMGTWENSFDARKAMYPEVDIWEIGGEISNPSINKRPTTPEAYMVNLKRLVSHIQNKHPGTVVTSSPTIGSGGGPTEFQKFIDLGLLDLDVIIAVNIYDFSQTGHTLQNYASIFSRYREQLSRKRVWITETGSPFPDKQIDYVNNFYPQLISTIHPEMICWYVMWDGDNAGQNGFGLIKNVSTPNPEERELFQALTRRP